MTTIVTRAGKGSPLTHTEVDTNFTNLNTNKLEAGAIALGSAATPSISFTGDTNTGIYSPGADQVAVATNGTQKLIVLSNGNVGIGNGSPGSRLEIGGDASYDAKVTFNRVPVQASNDGVIGELFFQNNADSVALIAVKRQSAADDAYIQFATQQTTGGLSEKMRLTSEGRLLVGTSTARDKLYNGTTVLNIPQLQIEKAGGGLVNRLLVTGNSGTTPAQSASELILARSYGTTLNSYTAVTSADSHLGAISFQGADGTEFVEAASIQCFTDAACGADDMPGRLVFSTTADGASTPTERMRITSGGFFKAKADTTYQGSTFDFHEFNSATNAVTLNIVNKHASYTSPLLNGGSDRAASSSYDFENWYSSYSGSFDLEFRLRGDGNGLCDGAWTGGGADYAEYFEWLDGNNKEEDRRGISVVLDGDKIRETVAGEDPIGVISGNPSVVGDSAWNKWSGKYLRDEFGTYIQEDYEVTDEDGNTVTQQRRKLNPAYDPEAEYIPREQRPEWDCVGLMGKLRIRKGQVTGSRWIKMRDISDSVEEWLVR